MTSPSPWPRRGLLLAVVITTAVWFVVTPIEGERPARRSADLSDTQASQHADSGRYNARPAERNADEPQDMLEGVVVRSYGRQVYQGRIDLSATIDRIRRGERFPHRNDGKTFHNREKRLPIHPPHYYKEYVHPTPGLRGPGPQRLVVGKGGEWYYTPDHYRSFVPLTQRARPPP